MLQIDGDLPIESGKPVLWYSFVKLLYGGTLRPEVPIGVQLLIAALVFARILSWCWARGRRRSFLLILLFVAAAPHVIFFQGALYSDGLFAIATTGLIFEIWLISRRGAISHAALCHLALIFPLAVFLRGNGVALLLLLFAAWPKLQKRDRIKLGAVVAGWFLAHAVLAAQFPMRSHGTLYPLALFETVNFLQPSPMGIRPPETRVSEKTLEILRRKQPVEEIVRHYDRDYWDPLVYAAGGPLLRYDSGTERAFVREFLRTNLWRNLPAFVSSRVNVFLVSAFAMGGFPGLKGAEHYLPRTRAISEVRPFALAAPERIFDNLFEFSRACRWLLWTPFIGIALAVVVFRDALRRGDRCNLWLSAALLLELAGIFVFSIAGEYRYLLPFFVRTAALLPIFLEARLGQSRPRSTRR